MKRKKTDEQKRKSERTEDDRYNDDVLREWCDPESRKWYSGRIGAVSLSYALLPKRARELMQRYSDSLK